SGAAPPPGSDKSVVRIGQGCADTNDNAGNFQAFTPAPRNTSSPSNVCGKGAKFEAPSVKLTDAGPCAAPGDVITVEVKFTNTGGAAQGDDAGSEFAASLPSGLIPLAGSCMASGGACAISGATTFEWNGPVKVNETVTITLRAQIGDGMEGAALCVAGRLSYD